MIRNPLKTEFLVVKKADETVFNSAVLQDDDELIFPVGANDVWEFYVCFLINTNTTADFKYCFTIPAASSLYIKNSHTGAASYALQDATIAVAVSSENGDQYCQFRMVYIGGANGGNIQLQWAQNTANASNTKVLTNSLIKGRKIN